MPQLRKGMQVIAVAALPNDGTSKIYGSPKLAVSSRMKETLDNVASDLDVNIATSTAATVDAMYREEYGLVDSWRKQGATIINMETSPLYAAARANNVDAVWLGQISDMLLPGQSWDDWYGDREAARALSDNIVVELVRAICREQGQ